MKLSELIAAYGDDQVQFQNLDYAADAWNMSKGITKITFGTPQPVDLHSTVKLGLVIWLDRDRVKEIKDTAANSPARSGDSYQARVTMAHKPLFHDDRTDIAERRDRFFEEANETCQAFGMTREEAHQLVDYTYNRAVGDPAKEIGAAMLTLTSLCVVSGHDLMACAEADLENLQRPETIARIRAKRATRHGRGPLPGLDPSPIGTDKPAE